MPWKRIAVITLACIIGFYIFFMAAYYATSVPEFCASCHYVAPYTKSWKKSAHKSVDCLFCHEFRGFLGKLHSKSRGLNYVYLHMTGQYSIIAEALVFENSCISCHLGDYGEFPKAPRLDKRHYHYLKQDQKCISCHREVGHQTNLFDMKRFAK